MDSGIPFGPRSPASLQKAQGPGVCKLPKPPASRALFRQRERPGLPSQGVAWPPRLSLTGQAADPGAETETREKILPNETEEGRHAGGIGRRAGKRQELAELATETTAEMQDYHQPDLQTSKR